jgi:murein DD-endopeptidase MepM/ murein hydrolase activator NlpD
MNARSTALALRIALIAAVVSPACGSSSATPARDGGPPDARDDAPTDDLGVDEAAPDAAPEVDDSRTLDGGPEDVAEMEDGEAAGDGADVFVEHVVVEGQTLWDIARSYGVSVQAIMEANGLRLRQVRKLSKGTVLRIPGVTQTVEVTRAADRAEVRIEDLPPLADGAYHILGLGETLWDVARLYDKTVDELAERNGYTDDDVRGLSVGTPIIVPGITQDQVQDRPPTRSGGIHHALAHGETIWNLASAFQVGVGQIMAANGLTAEQASALQEGTVLYIPGVREDRGGRVRHERTAGERTATAEARRLGLGTHQVAGDLLRGRVKRSWIEAAGGDVPPGTLRWPVSNGWYVRGYGSGEDGYHLATDIMGEMGWNVRAAAAGIVGYAGHEVRGYGNMVILIHAGGWVTMYAHNSVNFVVAGQHVPVGGIIAEIGSTGISRGPHVHFEFMVQGKNCKPDVLFRPGVRHRSGHIEELHYTTWTDLDDRPSSVPCAPRRHHPHSRWIVDENPEEEPGNAGTDAGTPEPAPADEPAPAEP